MRKAEAMPGFDGTGPLGQGPMTGRAAGYCTGAPVPGYMTPAPGRGFGSWGRGFRGRGGGGRGGGRGWRNRFYATGLPGWAPAGWGFGPPAPYEAPFAPPMTREQEVELLREQASYFNETLEDIKKRIEELSAQTKET